VLTAALMCSGCGYHSLLQQDEQVRAAWSDVASELQHRTDLVSSLLGALPSLAAHEQRMLHAVTEAQAKAVAAQLTPELSNDPAALARLEAAEADLSRALSGLVAIAERYREIDADPAFRELRAELTSTQARVARALVEYVDCVKRYNSTVQSFPSSLTARLMQLSARPNLSAESAPPVQLPAPPAVAAAGQSPAAATRPTAVAAPGS
jgi:LemA protein